MFSFRLSKKGFPLRNCVASTKQFTRRSTSGSVSTLTTSDRPQHLSKQSKLLGQPTAATSPVRQVMHCSQVVGLLVLEVDRRESHVDRSSYVHA